MRRVCIALLLCVVSFIFAKGEPNKFSNSAMMLFELKTILDTDGLKPKITDNGNLSFVVKGNSYLLEVIEDNGSLYFVRLSRFHQYESEITKETMDLFSRMINSKVVKVISAKSGYYLRAEFLLKDSQYFKDVYSRLIELIDTTHKKIVDECPRLSKSIEGTFKITNFKLLTDRTDSTTIAIYPMVTFYAPISKDSKYSVFVRLYRHNTLLQNKDSPTDYSYVDTLTNNQRQPIVMKYWKEDSLSDSASYRCELWYKENCMATATYYSNYSN